MTTQPTSPHPITVLMGLADNPAENEAFTRGVLDYRRDDKDWTNPFSYDDQYRLWRAWIAGYNYAKAFAPLLRKPFDLEGMCVTALASVQNRISRDFRDLAFDVAESFSDAHLDAWARHVDYCFEIRSIHGPWPDHWKKRLNADFGKFGGYIDPRKDTKTVSVTLATSTKAAAEGLKQLSEEIKRLNESHANFHGILEPGDEPISLAQKRTPTFMDKCRVFAWKMKLDGTTIRMTEQALAEWKRANRQKYVSGTYKSMKYPFK